MTVNAEVPRRPPKKCTFMEMLDCVATHPPWKCRAFSDIAPQEREQIIKDGKMCLFFLLHGMKDICYAKMSER